MAITRANRLSLQEHMDHLGLNSQKLSLRTGVEQAAVERALAGQPIAYQSALKICNYLSKEHKVSTKDGGGFVPEHIRGLQTWQPPDYDPQERQVRAATAEITRQRQQEAVRAMAEWGARTYGPAAQRSLEAEKQRQRKTAQPPRVASHHPAIIERRQPQSREQRARDYIMQGQAALARSKREEAEIRRKVARERAGYR